MKLKKSIFMAIIALGIVIACGEKRNKEDQGSSIEEQTITTEQKEEIARKEFDATVAKERRADSLRKVDSLQQVKEHGHVH
jgi:hypothetical protein